MEKRVVAKYLALYMIFVLLIAGLIFLRYVNLTGFAVFVQDDGTEFGEGTYSNIKYNGSAIALYGNNLTGTYTSKIFDAGNNATWNFLTWSGSQPNVEFIFSVDNSADVWESVNQAVTWSLVKDDYNGADGNGVTDSFFDSSKNHFIVYNQDVWKSTDLGATWIKVNDDYNGAEGQNAYVATIDKNNYIYIIEGDQDVWKSTDSGLTFTKVSTDFNGGNGNFFELVADSSNNLYAVDAQADVWKSANSGSSWSLVKDDYNGADGNNPAGMAIDSSSVLYILDLQDIWKSNNLGVTWIKVNGDFNGAGDAELSKSIITDSNNYIYVIDGGEDVFKSVDGGVTFTKVATNYNGANGITPTMANIIKATNLTLQARNCSLSDCSYASWQNVNINNLNLQSRYFQYKVSFSSPDTSVTPTLRNVSIDYDLINTAPTITLVKPGEGEAYGYNTSLPLEFSASDADNNIDSCWYDIDSGDNVIIANCANTTFNVAEGSHTLTIYVNDIYGLETSDSSNFTVSVGAPTISLSYPINIYLTSYDIIFRYTPTDMDLASCELWGFSANNFNRNQTNVNPTSGAENTFTLTLQDGTYIWNIKCNDSQGNNAINGNQTFTIDTVNPGLVLGEPSGTKSSRTVTAEWNVSDANLRSCWYNVYRGLSVEVVNTSVNCYLNSTTFSVTLDAEFTFNFYVNDSAGNENSSSLAFTVSTTSGGSSGGGGVGGGSSESEETPVPLVAELTLSGIGEVVVNPGESKTLSVTAKNIGEVFLNKCKLISTSDWISSKDVKGLSAGQAEDFIFVLNIPEDFSEDRVLEVSVECEEVKKSVGFAVLLSKDIVEVELVSSEQKNDKLNFVYLVKEKAGKNQEISAKFWLENMDKVKVVEAEDSFSLNAGEELEKQGALDLPDNAGDYVLNMHLVSDGFVIDFKEPILIGKSTGLVSGRAIFIAGGAKILGIAALTALFAFIVIYVVRKLIRKPLKETRGGYVKVKLDKKKESLE